MSAATWLTDEQRVALRLREASATAKQLGHSMTSLALGPRENLSRCWTCYRAVTVTPDRASGEPLWMECPPPEKPRGFDGRRK